jgi:glycosyltransferase involved in cell wall biosynthesis
MDNPGNQSPLLFSVVIPTFNRAKTIERAIDSAIAQEYQPQEILVVDDGSTDGTPRVLEKYCERIRYISQENRGVSAARNNGVKESRCDWIAFLDSDDYWNREHLKRIAEAIHETDGKASLYFTNSLWHDGQREAEYWDSCWFAIDGAHECRTDALEWAFMKRQPMLLQSSVIQRSRYLEIGILPEDLKTREDSLLFYRYCLMDCVCAVKGCGATLGSEYGEERLTRQHGTGKSSYWKYSVMIYRDLMETYHDMRCRWRKAVEERLVASYFGQARSQFRERAVGAALESIGRAFALDHGVFIKHLLLSIRSVVARTLGYSLS